MKSRISVFVVLSCLCVTSQNLSSNDQEKLDEMIFAQRQLKENDRNEWFLFETYDGASMYFNGKGVLQLNLKKGLTGQMPFMEQILQRFQRTIG